MEGFDKIKNIKLSDLDEDNTLEDQLKPEKKKDISPEKTDVSGKSAEDNQEERIPVGRHYEIDAEITEQELRNFRLAHEYRRPAILLVNAMAIFFIIYSALSGVKGMNLGITIGLGILIILYYPFIIATKTKGIKNNSKVFQHVFHYMLDEEGLHLKVDKEAVDVEWKYVRKLMVLKSSLVVYTGKANAWIIPTKDMGDQKDEIIAFLQEKIQTGK